VNSDTLYRVGTIAGVFGVRGELKCDPTEAGEPLFQKGALFYARPHERTIEIASVRAHKGRLLVTLREAPDMTTAEQFIGAQLFVERDRVDALLDEDEILDIDLIGTSVRDVNERILGDVVDVEHYPSSAMLVVGPTRVLVPFVKAYIVDFDRSARTLTLDLPSGLFD